ncbi:MAG: radical SAM protein [Patescibacteria group bacterium]|nr:radical SAM protein [Patescibacteria group bacterium]
MEEIEGEEFVIVFYPIKSFCNLRCKYCIYLDRGHEYYMPDIEVFHSMIKKVSSCCKKIKILWHGGEFLMAGKNYFDKVVKITKAYKEIGLIINHAGQTNGTMIDKEWINIFKEIDFEIGLSIDFPSDLNNLRVWPNGKTAISEISRGINLVINSGLKYSTTTIVTRKTLGQEHEIAEQLDALFPENNKQIFSPCYIGPANAKYLLVTGSEYADFVKKIISLIPQRVNEGELAKRKNLCLVKNECPKMLFVDFAGKWHLCSRFVKNETPFQTLAEYRSAKIKNYIGEHDCSILDKETRLFWRDFLENY